MNLNQFLMTLTEAGAAVDSAADGTTQTGIGEMIGMFLPLILMFVIFYFLLIRPQRKKDKKVKEMLAALKPGDRICTIGGIYGTIAALKEDTVTLKVGSMENTVVFARWAIRSVENVKTENDSSMPEV